MSEDRRSGDHEFLTLLKEIREDQLKIKKILLGNGEIGICEQVRQHENVIKDMKDIKKFVIRSFFGVGFAVLTAISVAAFMGFFKR
jgi:hypothetical protein